MRQIRESLIEFSPIKLYGCNSQNFDKHALNRDGKNGDFTAVLSTEHTFSKAGIYSIAARVQDNLDGQATVVVRIEVDETNCRIIEEKIVNL